MAKIILNNTKIVNNARVVLNKQLINFWGFITPTPNTTLSNFRVVYTGDPITVDWGDGQEQTILSNVNYSHTY
jgi:uncharacterized protein YmfQ (DUF2313 family)